MARKGAIVCSYSWYVRPQAAGAPPPGSLRQGRLAEAGRMRAGEHLPRPNTLTREVAARAHPGRGALTEAGTRPQGVGWGGATAEGGDSAGDF